ncbi:inositol monophosphatase [Alsobacter soli]|uniref:Inositol-1-monophosphatase n=1 Tax=Alsobacter soli TaxID=2109933 RepID=A0A2T1HPS7_9HYPH|nr:inositol monophosphatase family protein [Alsobacter soli]PSC03636.1 inositol monophosphatase [Alsobacter soli]
MHSMTLNARLDRATEIAREAGTLMRRRFADRDSRAYAMKGHQDFLTAVDGEVETLVAGRLRQSFPEDGIIGEEHGATGRTDGVWVVDPIDGTANFARGIAHFCISIAYVAAGEPVVGVIYDPVRDELFAAASGLGAALNGEAMRVSQAEDIRAASVECGWSMRRPVQDYIALCGRVMGAGAGLYRCGSGALGMAYVAAGRLDGYIELHINAWDVLAGVVLVREAGGRTNDFMGEGGLQRGAPILACAPGLAPALEGIAGIRL